MPTQPTTNNQNLTGNPFSFMDGGTVGTGGAYTPPTTPIKVNPSVTVDTNQLSQTPKTSFDIQSLLTQNQNNYQNYLANQQQYQKQYVDMLKPSDNITNLQKQLQDLRNQSLNVNLASQAGIQKTGQKVIPMNFIVGQQQNIMQQANLQLQSLAAQQAPLVDQLTLAQQARTEGLKSLETLMSFGKDNYQTAQEQMDFVMGLQKYQKELDQIDKQEQQAAKEFAMQNSVASPFYTVDGKTVYETSSGQYVDEKTFFEKNPQFNGSWAGVPTDFIQKITPKPDYSGLPASAAEYEYAKTQGFTGSYADYQNEDTNRKIRVNRASSTNNGDPDTGHGSTKEMARVKAIIASHPNEWGNAADQIDREFGQGTATYYDDLLTGTYAPKDENSDLDPAMKAWLGL